MEPQAKGKFKVCEKCPKKAYYNILGTRSPRFCGDHREPNMFNVVSSKCRYEGCRTVPCFGESGKPPKFCAAHREEGMVNIHERPCQHEGCSKKPVFNLPGQARGVWCVGHKTPEMVDVLSTCCRYEGCRTRPSFGQKGGKRMFCSEHKLEGMVNLVSIICEHDGCATSATFNLPGETVVRFCSKHKKEGMINIRMKPCLYEGCLKIPVFNLPSEKKGLYCTQHKLDGMIDVENPRCKTPLCEVHAKEYCARCTAYLFPDQVKGGWFKTRETKLKEHLESRYPDKTIVHDKRVECHLYRPDFVFDMGSHTIVIELDENQHKRYDTSCDNKRLMSIFHGLGSRPMVMLRFNPDRYDAVPGCFKKDGQLVDVGRPWKKRLVALSGRIDHWLKSQPDREITIEHLFFDTDK